jgi:hypothetical protein
VRAEGVALAGGAAIGLAISYLYTNVLLDAAPATRLDYMLAHARGLMTGVRRHPVAHFVAALGPILDLRAAALGVDDAPDRRAGPGRGRRRHDARFHRASSCWSRPRS